jgi:hypothetical protein
MASTDRRPTTLVIRPHLTNRRTQPSGFSPVVVGAGQRIFERVDPSSLQLELAEVRKLGNGSVILTYMPSQ